MIIATKVKNHKNDISRAITLPKNHGFYENLHTGRSHHAEHFYPYQNFDICLRFGVIRQKCYSDPYVLFLVTAAMFFVGTF